MMSDVIPAIILGFVAIAQQVAIHRLINKLMSRDYTDYAQGIGLSKTQKSMGKSIEQAAPEDLRALQEFHL